mgnify:CR=1 FL=1
MRIAAVVREDIAPAVSKGGFAAVFVVRGRAEAAEVLERIARERSYDLVLLDDAIALELGREFLSRLKYENPFPAIVELKVKSRPARLS